MSFINDFNDLVQHAPTDVFRIAGADEVRDINATLGLATLSNTFLV